MTFTPAELATIRFLVTRGLTEREARITVITNRVWV